jgi:ribosomal-protein-serine acetyltransferase
MSNIFPSLLHIPMPIITPRLLIRPPQAGDGPAFHAAIESSRDHLIRFLPWAATSHRHLEESEDWVRSSYTKFLMRSDMTLALLDRNQQTLVGGSGFHSIDWTLPKFEIGYWLHKDREGQGLMTEAVTALTRYAFEHLHATRVEIRCEGDNVRSQAVAERLGYTLDAILRQDRRNHLTKQLADTRIYSRLDLQGLPDLEVSW